MAERFGGLHTEQPGISICSQYITDSCGSKIWHTGHETLGGAIACALSTMGGTASFLWEMKDKCCEIVNQSSLRWILFEVLKQNIQGVKLIRKRHRFNFDGKANGISCIHETCGFLNYYTGNLYGITRRYYYIGECMRVYRCNAKGSWTNNMAHNMQKFRFYIY